MSKPNGAPLVAELARIANRLEELQPEIAPYLEGLAARSFGETEAAATRLADSLGRMGMVASMGLETVDKAMNAAKR